MKVISPSLICVVICHGEGVAFGSFEQNESAKMLNMDDSFFSKLMHMKMNQWQNDDEQRFLRDQDFKKL